MTRRTLYSPLGLLVAAAIFVIVNLVSGPVLRGARVDLTEGQLHTLSRGTLNILQNLQEPITLELFWSPDAAGDLPGLKLFARRVIEMLQEYESRAGGKLHLETIDPVSFSEEEDRAVSLGLRGVPTRGGSETIYFGLAASTEDGRSRVIPFIQPEREAFLEYDISQAIYALAHPARTKVGVLSALPIAGGPTPQNPFRAGTPWMITEQLTRQFDVEFIMSEESIPEDIDVLMVVYPHGLDNRALYAVDQYVLGGGRAVVFADPLSEYLAVQNPGAGLTTRNEADDLLEAWGVQLDREKVVGDMSAAQRVSYQDDNRVKVTSYLPWVALTDDHINREEVATAQLNQVNLGSAGSLLQAPGSDTSLVPLLTSSADSMLIEAMRIVMSPDPAELLADFTPAGVSFTMGARVTGPASTAFPDGPPASADADAGTEEPEQMVRSREDINVIVIADTDMLQDHFWVEVQDFFGQRVALPLADNADLVINALDQLGGSPDLIGIRTRTSARRPFELFSRVSREAELKYRAKEQELVRRLNEAETRLSELQELRQDPESPELTGQQEEELERFLEEKVRIRRELREVQFELRRDIKRLEAWIRFVNIGLVPLLLILFTVGFQVVRRRRKGV